MKQRLSLLLVTCPILQYLVDIQVLMLHTKGAMMLKCTKSFKNKTRTQIFVKFILQEQISSRDLAILLKRVKRTLRVNEKLILPRGAIVLDKHRAVHA